MYFAMALDRATAGATTFVLPVETSGTVNAIFSSLLTGDAMPRTAMPMRYAIVCCIVLEMKIMKAKTTGTLSGFLHHEVRDHGVLYM